MARGQQENGENNHPVRRARGQRAPRRRIWPIVRIFLIVGIWCFIAGVLALAWMARDLPDPDRLKAANPHPTVMILAANGETLAVQGDAYGQALDFDDLPPHLIHALIATEDRRFFQHPGFDVIGVLRSLAQDVARGHMAQGGSTLTQQLARYLFLNPKKTIQRKVQELLMALWLERRFSKDELLALYLNRMYFGAGAYGVEAAAETYFGKSARELDLAQSAMLMGVVQSPTRLSPLHRLDRAQARAAVVLDNMVEAGYLPAADAEAAKAHPATPAARATARGAQYFVDYVLDRMPDLLGPADTDIIVETTLDPKLQHLAEDAVTATLASEGGKLHVGQGALVAMAPDGAVKALVGGRSYSESPYDRAIDARRQPGSAFKPFVYLAGLEVGITPETIINDAPITIGKWSPRNFTGRFLGPIPVTLAFAESVNTVAVRVFQEAGVRRVLQTAHRLGITSDLHRDASLALGTGEVGLMELTGAYAPFANGGEGITPYVIGRIRSPDGDIYYAHDDSGMGQVIGPANLADMNRLMEGVMVSGTGKAARLKDRPSAGKTGTTQSYRDAWFMGFSADFVTGVWVGNDDDEPMKKVTGGGLPAQIWKKFMSAAHIGLPARPIPLTPRFPAEDEPLVAGDADRTAREVAAMEEMDREAETQAAPAATAAEDRPQPIPASAAADRPRPVPASGESLDGLFQKVSRDGAKAAQH